MNDVAGIILVGGASKRYGKPKALEEIDGKTFLERIFKELSEFTNKIFISYSKKTPRKVMELAIRLGGDLIEDKNLPCTGPPRGVSSISLYSINTHKYYFIVAVDYPYIKADTLGKMAEFLEKMGVAALTPLLPDGYLAVTLGYIRGETIKAMRQSCYLRKHLTRMTDIYRGAESAVYLDWLYLSKNIKEFFNINTPIFQAYHPPQFIQKRIILSQGHLFLESLDYIKHGEYRKASILYLQESEHYEILGLPLLTVHAKRDAQKVIELDGS
ncbi:MAG: NTP transferase domain-containing protein [Desulfurococcales archaeon]|nr:NTP transferase domain-containing protein [Desulfurococcales archaeon]